MRPKVVIITLLAAFSMLGLIAVFKSVKGKNAGDSGGLTTGATANPAATNSMGTQAGGASPAVVSDQLHAAMVDKEVEQIQQMQGEVDGTNNSFIIAALLAKGSHPEPDVRKAAVEALRQMNDTNAIPGLEKLAEGIQDAREKVAVLDAIDYLKLPNILPDNLPPDTNTNSVFATDKIPEDKMNQQFMRGPKKGTHPKHTGQRAVPQTGATPQAQ